MSAPISMGVWCAAAPGGAPGATVAPALIEWSAQLCSAVQWVRRRALGRPAASTLPAGRICATILQSVAVSAFS